MIELLYKLFRQYPVVVTDSRQVKPGSIFFALKGENFNGNRYAQAALEAGAMCAVVDERQYSADHRCLLVDDVLSTLQQLARFHRRQLTIPFIGITGSNGKTTTKELIARVLSSKYKTCFTQGNLNNHIGVPLTLLSVTADDEMAVVEMGANHPGEIADLCAIAEPDSGLITNIGRAHLEGFGGFEGVVKTKTELYNHLRNNGGSAFVNGANPLLIQHSEGIKRITYGNGQADITGHLLPGGPKISLAFEHQHREYIINTQLVGGYNFDNVMAAIAIGLTYGVEPEKITDAISHYQPSNHRSQWLDTGKNQVVIDAYNANPSSMEAALEVFAGIESDRSRVMILGGMRELGTESEAEHRQIVRRALAISPWRLILVGEEFRNMHNDWFANVDQLAGHLAQEPVTGALILVKGSRGNKLETILPLL